MDDTRDSRQTRLTGHDLPGDGTPLSNPRVEESTGFQVGPESNTGNAPLSESFGKYVIERCLGEGAMGTVDPGNAHSGFVEGIQPFLVERFWPNRANESGCAHVSVSFAETESYEPGSTWRCVIVARCKGTIQVSSTLCPDLDRTHLKVLKEIGLNERFYIRW